MLVLCMYVQLLMSVSLFQRSKWSRCTSCLPSTYGYVRNHRYRWRKWSWPINEQCVWSKTVCVHAFIILCESLAWCYYDYRSKRLRRAPEVDWRVKCRDLLDVIWQSNDSEPFREPVDLIEHPGMFPKAYRVVVLIFVKCSTFFFQII